MIEDNELPDPLTPKEAADQLRLAPATVIRWCQQGKLRAVQLGGVNGPWRIRRADWIAFKKWNAAAVQAGRRAKAVPGPSRQRAADRILDAAGV
jgi:excisionase family DNA binding protein